MVNNEELVNEIVQIKINKGTDYRHQKMTAALALLGYSIYHKRVYRIMKEQGVLNSKSRCTGNTRVHFKKVECKTPLEVLEIYIRYKGIVGSGRRAYIVSIIDIFTREALYGTTCYSIKQVQVKKHRNM